LSKTIKIRCTGAELLELDEAIALQGDLKDLSAENYKKLKKSILKYGFTFPLHIWSNKGTLRLIGGHQRCRALKAMRSEGYFIPKLPFDYIHADSEKEARELILASVSEYGNMTMQGLYEFIEQSDIDYHTITDEYRLPEIDYDSLVNEYYDNTEPSLDDEEPEDRPKINIVECPHCKRKFDTTALKR